MQCHLTKYVIEVPLRDLKATTIAKALAKYLICQFEAPKSILSHSSSFVADIVRELFHIYNLHLTIYSAYRPHTDGALEHSHVPLKDCIWCCSKKLSDLDKFLQCECAEFGVCAHHHVQFVTRIQAIRAARYTLYVRYRFALDINYYFCT